MKKPHHLKHICSQGTRILAVLAAVTNICSLFQPWVIVKPADTYDLFDLLSRFQEVRRVFATDANHHQTAILVMLLLLCLLSTVLHCCSIFLVLRDEAFWKYSWSIYTIAFVLPLIVLLLLYRFSLTQCAVGHEIEIEITAAPYLSLCLNMLLLFVCMAWQCKDLIKNA